MLPFQVGEHFFEVGDKIIGGLGLDDHIIDVSFDVVADLLIKAHPDCPLVGRLGVLESEGHSFVVVCTERCNERRFYLVFFLRRDLMIAGVAVKEGE